MGWRSSIVNKVKVTKKTISSYSAWAWGWTYKPLVTTTTYTANTLVYLLNQVIALRYAIPALTTPEPKKIIKAAMYITWNKILWLSALNSLNSLIQISVRNEPAEEADTSYNRTLLTAVTLVDWVVWCYSTREAAELMIETYTMISMGPAAFTRHKEKIVATPNDPCIHDKCNFKRRLKGSLREPLILAGNELLIFAIRQIPYGGESLSFILSVYCYGDYISRSVNIHCERHKSTDSELLLALGLSYTMSNTAIKLFLEAITARVPWYVQASLTAPWYVQISLNHLMLLWHINNTAHMTIPYVAPGKGTLTRDPLLAYERVTGFITDIQFAGIKYQLAQLSNKAPKVPLSYLLRFLTTTLNSDLEKVDTMRHGFFKKTMKKVLPPIFRSTQDTIRNPVLIIFWPDMQEFLLEIASHVKHKGLLIEDIPGVKLVLPNILFLEYGISKKVTKFILHLCEDKDFNKFLLAFKQWLDRHNVKNKKSLTAVSSVQLNLYEGGDQLKFKEGDKTPLPIPVSTLSQGKILDPIASSKKNFEEQKLDPNRFINNRKKAQNSPLEIKLDALILDNYP